VRAQSVTPVLRRGPVTLIVYYVIFMIAGDFAAYFLGLLVEYEWGPQVSLIVFLALYFLSLWVAWVLSVWVTKPRGATSSATWKHPGRTQGCGSWSGCRRWLRLVVVLRRRTVISCLALFLAPPAQWQLSRRSDVCAEIIGHANRWSAPCVICALG